MTVFASAGRERGGSRMPWRNIAATLCVAALGLISLGGAASAEAEERFGRSNCGSIVARQSGWESSDNQD